MEIPAIVHPSWHTYLQPLFDDFKMTKIRDQILTKVQFRPDPQNIFRVFSMPLEDIKVVILGQDPYPDERSIGLSFAVNTKSAIPSSLDVIAKELRREFPNQGTTTDRTLQNWVDQGVFLLNSALTVEKSMPGSHTGIWEWFTKEVVNIISSSNPCIWLLWGAKAQGFKSCIFNGMVASKKNITEEFGEFVKGKYNDAHLYNYILEAPHPQAERYGNAKKFTGCDHFILCNEVLSKLGKSIINW